MAYPKKGALKQIVFPMVDATDFGSVESGITESDFNSGATRKFFGWDEGVSTATTSGTVSKTASLVRSGVFRLTLKTTENNYDNVMVRISKTGCAEQILTWQNVDNDDSDIRSAITLLASGVSDAHSAAAQANSRVLLVQSSLSDVQSAVTLVQSLASDAHSAAAAGASRATLLISSVSDIQSKISDVESNLISLLTTTGVQLNASTMSDIRSAIGAVSVTLTASDISDLASAVVAGIGFDPSDIASAVNVELGSRLSDILSAAVQGNSRILVVQSMASDAASAAQQTNSRVLLLASAVSDVQSAVTVVQSMASDAASAAQQTNSRVLLNQSRISDVYSMLSDLQSDFQSRVPKAVATNSQLSDLASDLRSVAIVAQSSLSDIYSLLQAGVPASSDAVSDIVVGVLAGIVEGTTTVQQSLRLANTANAGKLAGAATTTVTIRDLADTKDRITATVDANGNRTAVTLDVT